MHLYHKAIEVVLDHMYYHYYYQMIRLIVTTHLGTYSMSHPYLSLLYFYCFCLQFVFILNFYSDHFFSFIFLLFWYQFHFKKMGGIVKLKLHHVLNIPVQCQNVLKSLFKFQTVASTTSASVFKTFHFLRY